MSSKHDPSVDVQTNQTQEKMPLQPKNPRNYTKRILAVAIVLSVAIVGVACFINMRDKRLADEHASQQAASASIGVIPSTESEAADRAEKRNEQQVNGMIAPSDVGDVASEAISASEASATSAAYSPADDLLADEDINQYAAKIQVDNGVAKFTFAPEKVEVGDDVYDALSDVLSGAQSGKKVAIVGITDSTETTNLGKQRVFVVRDILLAAGVPESQIEIRNVQKSSKSITHHVEVLLQ